VDCIDMLPVAADAGHTDSRQHQRRIEVVNA
jgi:hypothetical protein